MRLPTMYDDDMLRWKEINYPLPEGKTRSAAVSSLVYPPVGFFPFYDIGNGDEYGFYWPIGKEEEAPLVASMSHDAVSLIPEYSTVESMYQCRLTCSSGEDDIEDLHDYRELLKNARALGNVAVGRQPKRPVSETIASDDFLSLLRIDPSSPFYLCASADLHAANDRLNEAEEMYRASLALCPDYVAAHFGLAAMLRETRPSEATTHFRNTLLGPPSLYGGSFWKETSLPGRFRRNWHRKSLTWLQSCAEPGLPLENDPFLNVVNQLKFSSEMAEVDDLHVLDDVLNRYIDLESFEDAAKVWQSIGHYVSFGPANLMDVMRITPRSFGTRLAELFKLAGNKLRSSLVSDMLERIKDPDGCHL